MSRTEPASRSARSERHDITAADIREGDTLHVTAADCEVDHAAVIARWKFRQRDFSPDAGSEIPSVTRKWMDLTDEDGPVEFEDTRIMGHGDRSTLMTEDGRKFAVVDWKASDDPPYLYLLVIDSEDPDERRWTSLGPVEDLKRHGPEPEGRRSFDWTGSPPWDASEDADPEFAPRGDGDE